jgi:uncharacterized phiE125 gp8 family phage protein
MGLTLITPPLQSAVSLDMAKTHLRVDHNEEDAIIAAYVEAATQSLDGIDGALGRCLINQTWKLTLDSFPEFIEIPLPPCQSITSVTYVDVAGAVQTLAPINYQAVGLGGVSAASIHPAYGKSWPSARSQPEAISVTFVAGYGPSYADIPEPIIARLLARVGALYAYREGLPTSDDDFLINYRTWAF